MDITDALVIAAGIAGGKLLSAFIGGLWAESLQGLAQSDARPQGLRARISVAAAQAVDLSKRAFRMGSMLVSG